MSTTETGHWKKTACILCAVNCGLEVQTSGERIVRIRGDKANPVSEGYLCEKSQRMAGDAHFEFGGHRLPIAGTSGPPSTPSRVAEGTPVRAAAAPSRETAATHFEFAGHIVSNSERHSGELKSRDMNASSLAC